MIELKDRGGLQKLGEFAFELSDQAMRVGECAIRDFRATFFEAADREREGRSHVILILADVCDFHIMELWLF